MLVWPPGCFNTKPCNQARISSLLLPAGKTWRHCFSSWGSNLGPQQLKAIPEGFNIVMMTISVWLCVWLHLHVCSLSVRTWAWSDGNTKMYHVWCSYGWNRLSPSSHPMLPPPHPDTPFIHSASAHFGRLSIDCYDLFLLKKTQNTVINCWAAAFLKTH